MSSFTSTLPPPPRPPSKLACIAPTRVLVVLNALSDADLHSEVELADIIADIAIEVAAALSLPALTAVAATAGQEAPTEPGACERGGRVRLCAARA